MVNKKTGARGLRSIIEALLLKTMFKLPAMDDIQEVIVNESIVKSIIGLTKTKDVQVVLKLALDGKISDARDKMIELIKVYGMWESDFLKYVNQASFNSKNRNIEDMLEVIAKYDYRILVGANPEIQLSALLAELAKLGK